MSIIEWFVLFFILGFVFATIFVLYKYALTDTNDIKGEDKLLKSKAEKCRYYDDANCWYWKQPCKGLPCDIYTPKRKG